MPPNDHHAQKVTCVDCAIVTVSDTRTPDSDTSGALIRELLTKSGHRVVGHEIVPDEPSQVRERVVALCAGGTCQAVILTGGTGLSPRDTTYEVVVTLLEKRIDGFGELFRMLSFQEIGPAAMLSRAVAGVCRGTVVFSLPGSTGAVRLGMERLILPQLAHMVWLLQRS